MHSCPGNLEYIVPTCKSKKILIFFFQPMKLRMGRGTKLTTNVKETGWKFPVDLTKLFKWWGPTMDVSQLPSATSMDTTTGVSTACPTQPPGSFKKGKIKKCNFPSVKRIKEGINHPLFSLLVKQCFVVFLTARCHLEDFGQNR